MADPTDDGQQRCHGGCAVKQPRLDGAAQAWAAAGRPPTCMTHHNLRFNELLDDVKAYRITAEGLTEVTLHFTWEERDVFRAGATAWELDHSRVLRIVPGRYSLCPAIPVVDDSNLVLGYIDTYRRAPWYIWIAFRDVQGNLLTEQPFQEIPIEHDDIGQFIIDTLGTVGIGLAIQLIRGMAATLFSISGDALLSGAINTARGITRAAIERCLAILARLAGRRGAASVEAAWKAFLGSEWGAKAIRLNYGGLGEMKGWIDVNNFFPTGRPTTPAEVIAANPTGKLLQTGVEDLSMVPNNSVDQISSRMFNAGMQPQMDAIAPKMAAEAKRVLKPGGKALIHCTNPMFREGTITRAVFEKAGFVIKPGDFVATLTK